MKRRQILIPACAALLFFGIMLLTEQLLAPPYFVKSLIKLLLICTLIGIGTVLSETGLKESIRFQPMQKAGWLILFMIAVMILTGAGFAGRAREKLPIAWLFAYCLVACISSIDGWMPFISYLKIAQFVLFLAGLLFITRILQQSDEGLYQLRCVFMAMAIIFLWGSILSRFIPSVGYSMTIQQMANYGIETPFMTTKWVTSPLVLPLSITKCSFISATMLTPVNFTGLMAKTSATKAFSSLPTRRL